MHVCYLHFLKKEFFKPDFMCMSVWWYECMCVHYMVQCSQRQEEGIGSLESRIASGCKPSHGCWELNLGPLKKQKEA